MNATRRELLQTLVALGAVYTLPQAATRARLRLAICNETFAQFEFAAACKAARFNGYTGLEIAPFTLAEDPLKISPSRRAELRKILRSEGISYAGLHSLLTTPQALNVVTNETSLRRRSWDHVHHLLDLSGDLAGSDEESVMVFGSGKQRTATAGTSVADAVKRFTEGLAELAPAAQARRVRILIEPLSPQFTNVINTVEDAVAIVEQINSPSVQTMFDTHNSVAERMPHGDLIRKYRRHIYHIHLNEMDGRHPGTGNYKFGPVLQALKDIKYQRWVSIEVFDFTPGGEKIAREAARFVREQESKLR